MIEVLRGIAQCIYNLEWIQLIIILLNLALDFLTFDNFSQFFFAIVHSILYVDG